MKEIEKPLTAVETIDLLILEATNSLTRNDILNKMHFVMSLEGNKQLHEKLMGGYQQNVRMSKDSIRVLGKLRENMIKEESVDKPVEKKKKEKVK